ncbi:DoxX family protein [Sandarakinorhabdus oryzae]|uniref:DoxX family protein n=1 Tax=Sandarakinorhabdus oryzae TaxID=2675220 RepID=UPI0012E1C793|nr:DoxX family protein [Sandarakinorhabdus oryzae]
MKNHSLSRPQAANASLPWTWLLCASALALPFLVSGIAKLADYTGAIAEVADITGLPGLAPVLTPLVILLQLAGGICLFGPPPVRGPAVLALSGFTLLASILAHDFWNAPLASRVHELTTFCEHLGLIAGLVLLHLKQGRG